MENSEFPFLVDVAVLPKPLKRFKTRFGFGNACSDVVVCAGVFCDDDSEVFGLLFDFDFRWLVCFGFYVAVVGVEVYICACILSDELTFSQVEFQVVVLCCALYQA